MCYLFSFFKEITYKVTENPTSKTIHDSEFGQG